MPPPKRFGFALAAALCCAALSPADEASAKRALEQAGFSVSSSRLAAKVETEISSDLRSITKRRRELLTATRELAGVESKMDQFKAQIARLQYQQAQLSTQLANVRPGDVESNNRLVGALNALRGQVQLLEAQQPKAEETLATARGEWNSAREAYLQTVLDIGENVAQAEKLYEESASDPTLVAAVEQLNEATGKSYSLEPSRLLTSARRRLSSLEDEVLTEAIALRRQGNTLYASVVVNGKYDKEMVVDSGASILSLPLAVAKELGVEPTPEDPPITLVVADGRTISGRLVKLDEVRVGQFTVKDVEAAVLGPEAVNAEPLLGMSFLGKFKFELDSAAATLTLIDVEGANPADEKPKSSRR